MADIQYIEQLIRDLVSAFVERPTELRLKVQPSDDGNTCYWAIKADPVDDPLLIGAEGSHVRALTFLIAQFGLAHGMTFTFRLLTEDGKRLRPRGAPRDVIEYDAEPALEILQRLMTGLGIRDVKVRLGAGVGPRKSLSYIFTISACSEENYRALTHSQNAEGMTVVGAIGTLFRAVAKKSGVRFNIEVERGY